MKLKFSLFDWVFGGVFSLVGVIFMTVGILISIHSTKFYETARPVQATIVDFERSRSGDSDSRTAVVKYNVEGKEYVDNLGYYSSSMRYGDRLTIYYQPGNPLDISCKEGDILWLLFLPMGFVFFVIGAGYFSFRIFKARRNEWLLKHGERVMAEIGEITLNTSINMNGRHPYVLHCYYKAPDGTTYDFDSPSLWRRRHEIPEKGKVPVYVADRNFKKYVVDVDNAVPEE